jgi:hypothetical protein
MSTISERYPNLTFPVSDDQVNIEEISSALRAFDKYSSFDPYVRDIEIKKEEWKTEIANDENPDGIPVELKGLIQAYCIKRINFKTDVSDPDNTVKVKTFKRGFGTIKIDNTADNIDMVDNASRCTVLITDFNFIGKLLGQELKVEIAIQARTGLPTRDITLEVWFW